MSEASALLRQANSYEFKGEASGIVYGFHLPRLRDCILAGDVPLPVLAKLDRATANPEEMTTEDMRHVARFNDAVVRSMVDTINGADVALDEDDLGLVPEDDYNELVAFGTRQKDPHLGEA